MSPPKEDVCFGLEVCLAAGLALRIRLGPYVLVVCPQSWKALGGPFRGMF